MAMGRRTKQPHGLLDYKKQPRTADPTGPRTKRFPRENVGSRRRDGVAGGRCRVGADRYDPCGGIVVSDEMVCRAFSLAVQHYRAGRVPDSAALCRQVLQSEPNHVDAMRLLAILALQESRPRDAEQLLRKAISLAPKQARLQNDLGTALAASGQTERSIGAFRTAWNLNPTDPDVTCNLGMALMNSRAFADAGQVFLAGTRYHPNDPQLHVCLGDAQREAGLIEESISSYTHATDLAPSDAQIHFRLGIALKAAGRTERALKSYQRATELLPTLAEAHFNAANILKDENRFPEAAEAYARALSIRPDYLPALQNLAFVFQEGGRLDDAESTFRHVVQLQPHSLQGLIGLGNVLRSKDNFPAATAMHRRALELNPDVLEASTALAATLQRSGADQEAATIYKRVLASHPDNADVWADYAFVLSRLRESEASKEASRRAMQLRPKFPNAQLAYAMGLLAEARFAEGWEHYEARLDLPVSAGKWRTLPQPIWEGEDLRGRRLLVHREQGLGDVIQFVRFIPLLVAQGAKVILRCHSECKRLLEHSFMSAQIVLEDEPLPDFDLHVPLLSLPRLLCTTLDSIPAIVPYLTPPDDLVSRWHERLLGDPSRLSVGLAWAGSTRNTRDFERSMPLSALKMLSTLPGIDLYSLQKGAARTQLTEFCQQSRLIDLSDELNDLADTAAAMTNLDLVLSVDTLVAHLSGALARPTWLMLPYNAEWRWMRDRSDSPWYPTMRLFRQQQRGDWDTVVSRISQAILNGRSKHW